MFGNGVNSRLKSFDMYRKLPSDLTEPTLSGALVSLLSTMIMIVLFVSEFNGYLAIEETSEMFVDVSQGLSKIRVNLDLDFTRLPCDILSLDLQDIMGSHSVNVEGDITKVRLSAQGAEIERIKHHSDGHGHSDLNFERTKKAFAAKEGCKVTGFMLVNKVPGNFHISAHSYGN